VNWWDGVPWWGRVLIVWGAASAARWAWDAWHDMREFDRRFGQIDEQHSE